MSYNRKSPLEFTTTPNKLCLVCGFTLIEVIIVSSFLIIITAGLGMIFRNQIIGDLESDAQIIALRLTEAQSRAISGNSGSAWGIYFDNSGSSPLYSLFLGNTYVTSSSTYYLSNLTQFQTPTSGATSAITFTKLTGRVATTTTSTIVIQLKNDTSKTKTITVSPEGKITVN